MSGPFAAHPVPFAAAMARGLFRARIVGATDADTIVALLDSGHDGARTLALRVAGVNAAEVRGGTPATRAAGKAAALWADAAVRGRWALVRTYRQSFARYVADVALVGDDGAEQDFAALLVAEGLAVRVMA